MRCTIQLLPSQDGQWYYRVQAANDQTILTSETYTRHWSAQREATKLHKITG